MGETRLWLSSFRNDAVGIRQSWFTSVNFFFLFRIHLVKVGSSCWSELLCCHWLYNKDRIISFVFSSICRWWLTNLVNWHSGIVFALFALILIVIRYWNINIQKNLYAGKKVKFFSLCEIFLPSFVIFQQQIMCLQDQKFVWISNNNVIKFFQGYKVTVVLKAYWNIGLKAEEA